MQAWCEAAAGDLPLDSDFEADTATVVPGGGNNNDWLAETSESQQRDSRSLSLRQALPPVGTRPGAQQQQQSPLLDPVEEASSEGTPSSAVAAAGRVHPIITFLLQRACALVLAGSAVHPAAQDFGATLNLIQVAMCYLMRPLCTVVLGPLQKHVKYCMQGGSGSVEGPAESDRQGEESSSSAAGFWQVRTGRHSLHLRGPRQLHPSSSCWGSTYGRRACK